MGEKSSYYRFADKYLNQYSYNLSEYFRDLKTDLKKANIPYTLSEYLSGALMTSILVFIFVTPTISVLAGLIAGNFTGMIAGLIMGLFIGIFLSVATFMGFYIYPRIQVSRRRTNINHNLPFATMYLSTVAGTGTPPAAMFKLLGQFDEYGEVSGEAEKIANNVYNFGADINEAIASAANNTPSPKFKELLWGMNSILKTGGDMKSFLRSKTKEYMADYRRDLDKFTETLSLLVEMYITLVIVGSVFVMIISTIMSALGGSNMMILAIQVATVVFLLPLAAIMFIVIVKGTSPLE
ncbi:MAG: type II secretion system F family protein [Candidatus Nanohaloarchaeota archaeon QJJ-9]|nr:type II secretion system F family protein [Candidatus Nanohaloarchaeota archaeon QJJ-9]